MLLSFNLLNQLPAVMHLEVHMLARDVCNASSVNYNATGKVSSGNLKFMV